MYIEYFLREFKLPPGVPGMLAAGSMPGLESSNFDSDAQVIQSAGIDRVICLTSPLEVRLRSPQYAEAMERGTLVWNSRQHAIDDGSVPEDREALLALARETAEHLRGGGRVLIHCAAGIGRTGMLAVLVLMALGMGLAEARRAVRAAGSGAEDPSQRALEAWAASQLGG